MSKDNGGECASAHPYGPNKHSLRPSQSNGDFRVDLPDEDIDAAEGWAEMPTPYPVGTFARRPVRERVHHRYITFLT